MSTLDDDNGRVRQKQRTRAALISATRELIASGGTLPTVAEAAEHAAVSRATAYRYYPSQRSLLLAAHPEIDSNSMLPADLTADAPPEERLEAAVRGFLTMVLDTEPQQRTMLRMSLDPQPTPSPLSLRQGRAIGWFAEALEPLAPTLGSAGIRRVAIAIRALAGIESLVWLTDVAGMTRAEAVEQMVWSAVAVLRRAVDEARLPQSNVAGGTG